jgi:hypothetical protein
MTDVAPSLARSVSGAGGPLPTCAVVAQIFESDFAHDAVAGSEAVTFGWEILEGSLKGRTLRTTEIIKSGDAQAQEIGQRTLKRICEAAGMGPIRNTDELHFKPMRLSIVPTGEGNDIKGYRPFARRDAAESGPVDHGQLSRTLFDPWQAFPVPAFPLDTLPPPVRNFVDFQARNIGADPSGIAMAALAACSGAIDHRFGLKMMENGDWYASPRMWVLLVGPPSSKKSPALTACLKPLRAAEHALERDHAKAVAKWQELKDAGEKTPAPAPAIRYTAGDVTMEKLGELLSHQDRGLLVVQDELSAWIGSMDKYSGGGKGGAADRGFWLQAYNGGTHRVDRIGRGSVAIENCSVSLVGGIQPNRLAELGNLNSDGLLQRFLPVMMSGAQLPQDIADDGAVEAYGSLMSQLAAVEGCRQFMSPGAMRVAKEFQQFAHEIENTGALGEHFCSFVGKLHGVHGSLALILHLATDPTEARFDQVSEETAQAAARIVREFVIPHAMALYQEGNDKADWEYLRALCSFILTSTNSRFVPSDFSAGVRAMRGKGGWDIGQMVSPLVAGGWLTEDRQGAVVRGWSVVPGVREVLATRRDMELARKAEALRALQALRGTKAAGLGAAES